MSAFSFTAPYISDEQQQEEYRAMTDAEKQILRDDKVGHENSFLVELTPSDRVRALKLFEEAMSTIPSEDQEEYLHALEVAPELVHHESDPLVFLRGSKYDAWNAAQRRVHYWKLRKDIFGPERAFLPLTALPGGALNDEDRRVLNLGLIGILPCDSSGRRVIFMNRSKMSKALTDRGTYLRAFFYMLHTVVQQEESQLKGIVGIVNCREMNLYKNFDRILSKKMLAVKEVMGADLKAYHLVTGSGRSVLGLVIPFVRQIYGKDFRHRLYVQAGSNKEVLANLAVCGLTPASIPNIFGGTWDMLEDFSLWLEQQQQLEKAFAFTKTNVDST